jgi:hypothetical protein
VFRDSETGLSISQIRAQYTIDTGHVITYGIALPGGLTGSSPYDAVVQIAAPLDVGWVGLSWGGRMTGCPLTVAWQNGNSVVISSHFTP